MSDRLPVPHPGSTPGEPPGTHGSSPRSASSCAKVRRGSAREPSAALLEWLWRDRGARSRNRNFERFRDDEAYRRAVLRVRSLRALRRDLLRYAPGCRVELVGPQASGCAGRVRLTFEVPSLRLRRTTHLSAVEAGLLLTDPVLARVIDREACLDRAIREAWRGRAVQSAGFSA